MKKREACALSIVAGLGAIGLVLIVAGALEGCAARVATDETAMAEEATEECLSSTPPLQECGSDTDCSKGFLCVNYGGPGSCLPLCEEDSDCCSGICDLSTNGRDHICAVVSSDR
jgi:hypothetical protein